MRIEVIPTYQGIQPLLTRDKICIVIDILRATSTIVTALQHGCKKIIVAASPQEALELHKSKENYILGGESAGGLSPVFQKGNSPLEYIYGMENQSIIFVTTNGTRAITKSHKARCLAICSLLNIGAVAKWLVNCGGEGVLLCCAGTRGKLALEDFYTAGGIIKRVADNKNNVTLSTFALFAKDFYTVAKKKYRGKIRELFQKTLNGKRLVKMGMSSDLDFCCQEDVYSILPFCTNSVIKIREKAAPEATRIFSPPSLKGSYKNI
ncbi:MAG: 2-phosphosulfolactate phosphatase [Dethiobacteria bacterium]|jgi:2-phosphosulfolactate phosphatase